MSSESEAARGRLVGRGLRCLTVAGLAWVALCFAPLAVFGRVGLDEWLTRRVGFVQSAEWIEDIPARAGFGVFVVLIAALVLHQYARWRYPAR